MRNVVLDGTRSIDELRDINNVNGIWNSDSRFVVKDDNSVITAQLYKIKLRDDVKIWQLFHNRREIINARYPSAQWENDEVYDLNNWGHGYYNLNDVNGTMKYYDNGEIVDISNSNVDLYNFVSQQQTINSNFDLIGSLINLNVGSFKSYTKIVNSQTMDDVNNIIRLSYDPVALWKEKHHYYYLENKIEFLNSENEWFFDSSDNYLYVWLNNDEIPSLTNIRAKVQTHTFNLTAPDINIKNISFFGTTFKGNNADNLIIHNCNFLYPSCYAHMLNQINYGTDIDATSNEVFNNQTNISSFSRM